LGNQRFLLRQSGIAIYKDGVLAFSVVISFFSSFYRIFFLSFYKRPNMIMSSEVDGLSVTAMAMLMLASYIRFTAIDALPAPNVTTTTAGTA
jgi:exosortase/archaeosortase